MELSLKKILALLVLSGLLVAFISGAALGSPPWSDASSSWWVSSYGVTETQVATVADGYPNGTFRPGLAVNRGQFTKMAVSGLGVGTASPAAATFKDVIKSNALFPYVEGAHVAGLIGGIPSSGGLYFKPGLNITRQQADSMLGRYLSALEIDVTGAIHGATNNFGTLDQWYNAEGSFQLKAFDDAGKVGSSHKAATAYLIYRDIVKGSGGKLSPTSTLTRAQAAALVLRVKAEAEAIKTPPTAPSNLAVIATGPGKTVTFNSGTQQYVGNDETPQVTGDTLAGRPIAIYDNSVKLVEDNSNSAGKFYTDVLSSLSDGSHSFTAKVKNENGLVSPASASVSYVLDTVLPTVSIVQPTVLSGQTTALIGSVKPDFTASVTDERSGIKQVEFQCSLKQATPSWQTISLDTAPDSGTNMNGTYSAVWPSTGTLGVGLTDGTYVFRVIATDNAGNQRISTSLEVTLDTVKPTVTITAPVAAGIYYTENPKPTFTATAQETIGGSVSSSQITSVQFYYATYADTNKPTTWDGFTLIYNDTTPDWAASYTAPLSEGHYIFAARATDVVGNQSALLSGTTYAAGATQEVVVDSTPPVLSVSVNGLPDGHSIQASQPPPGPQQHLTITWNLRDTSPPDKVDIDYTLDALATNPVWTEVKHGADNTGSYEWTVPEVTGDKQHVEIRILATDKAGPQVGNVSGHTTAAMSTQFTIYDLPVAVTGINAQDLDLVGPGVDGRDFTVSWTPSLSPDIVSQAIYIVLASETSLNLSAESPVATFTDNTTSSWTGTESLTTDSSHAALAPGNYRVFILVTDLTGHTASWQSDPFTVAAP